MVDKTTAERRHTLYFLKLYRAYRGQGVAWKFTSDRHQIEQALKRRRKVNRHASE